MNSYRELLKILTDTKNIDYTQYFKIEFNKLINKLIEYFDINLVFNAIYYSFNIDIYIMTKNDEKIDLNLIKKEDKKTFIERLIVHLTEFYKNEIVKFLQKILINTLNDNNINYFNCTINEFDLKENKYFIFKRICENLNNIRKPIIDLYCNKQQYFDKDKLCILNIDKFSYLSLGNNTYSDFSYCQNDKFHYEEYDFLNICNNYYKHFNKTELLILLINSYMFKKNICSNVDNIKYHKIFNFDKYIDKIPYYDYYFYNTKYFKNNKIINLDYNYTSYLDINNYRFNEYNIINEMLFENYDEPNEKSFENTELQNLLNDDLEDFLENDDNNDNNDDDKI